MTVAAPIEERPADDLIFGQIELHSMTASPEMTRAVLPLVKQACFHSGGRFTVDTVVDGLIAGRLKIWGVLRRPATLEAVAVTTVTPYDSGVKAYELLLFGGPRYEMPLRYLEQFKEGARAAGCDKIVVYGLLDWGGFKRARAGAGRLTRGWRVSAVVYECDLREAASSDNGETNGLHQS